MAGAKQGSPEGQRLDASDETHGLPAAGALDDGRLWGGHGRWGEHAEEIAQAGELGFSGGAEEPAGQCA